MPKVSVIVPVYNAQRYLRECLDSIASQTLRDIEIICINDGSTDDSPRILREYAARDGRFLIIDKPNEGYGRGMNDGISRASGEYIGIVESDDYIVPEMYEVLYGRAVRNDLDLIKADFWRFHDEGGRRVKLYARLVKSGTPYNTVIDPKEDERVFRNLINTWSGIYKRSFLEKHQIRHNTTPGASFQDNGFWFQTFAWADRIMFVDQAFYMNRRDNPDSSVKRRDGVYCVNDEYRWIYEFLNRHPDLKERFVYSWAMKRARSCFWNYSRIAKEYRREYARTLTEEFRVSMRAGELRRSCFSLPEWIVVLAVTAGPLSGRLMLDVRMCFSRLRRQNTER